MANELIESTDPETIEAVLQLCLDIMAVNTYRNTKEIRGNYVEDTDYAGCTDKPELVIKFLEQHGSVWK